MRRAYDFDQVALVPQFNNVPSRTIPDLESWLTRGRRVQIPLLASNMDTVIGPELAEILIENGTYPIYHRFTDFEGQKRWVARYRDKTFISCGVYHLDRVRELLDLGALGACIDVAHGHSEQMMHYIGELKRSHPDKDVIAGNVCTAMAYHDLVNAGADAVKVGIGSGSACTTRAVTAFGISQFTAIQDCAGVAEKLRVPLIADGGIRGSRDLVLALAAGASTVMIGRLFALTAESAAPKRSAPSGEGGLEAKYRGQASEDFQNDFYGGLKEYTVAEGVHFWAPVSGPVQGLIDTLLGGLRSGMTYAGAKSIKELQRKAEFVAIGG